MDKSKLVIYHGSSVIVDKPTYALGNIHNDYGQGFYCTEDVDLAREWACTGVSTSWCNEYLLDAKGLNVLRLDSDEFNELHWLAILLNNRLVRLDSIPMQTASQWIIDNYLVDISDYDVIIGYRADDSFFSIARAFVNNAMPLEMLQAALKRGDLGLQVVLKSRKAYDRIEFVRAERVDSSIYYPRRNSRSKRASEWFFSRKFTDISQATYLSDLIRQENNNESI